MKNYHDVFDRFGDCLKLITSKKERLGIKVIADNYYLFDRPAVEEMAEVLKTWLEQTEEVSE